MKSRIWCLSACTSLLLIGCQSNHNADDVASLQFVHKYGFDVSEQEWDERSQDGKAIVTLRNGVKITRSYEDGQLHGSSTYTFPHSATIEKLLVYDQGTLLREVIHDISGTPISEQVYEFDDRKISTFWDEKGVPLAIEEYDGELLQEGKYYTPEHELEAKVENGFGERIKRDRSGVLLCHDKIENGMIAQRASYHPNGQMQSLSHYHDYQLHGEQTKYTASGKPLMSQTWNHGVLDGAKLIYRNGLKVAQVPFINGQKHGIEQHFDDLGNLTAEIQWKNDKKHGASRFHSEESTECEWFYKGQLVTEQKFELLENRERLAFDTAPATNPSEE